MNIAVILAGGSGNRLDNSLPKQFYKLAGKMVIEHTLDVFQHHPEIDEIAIVSNPAYVHDVERLCIKNQYSKVKKILLGGKERYQSSLVAINAYEDDEVNLLFHDAVRPLVNDRIISECISKLRYYNAVDVAVPTTDTMIQVNESGIISGIPFRKLFQNGQTPQAFKLGIIRKAYKLALEDPDFRTTDDCSVVYNYLPDEKIFVVRGESFNMKLTYKEDLYLLDKWFQLKSIDSSKGDNISDLKGKLSKKVMVVFGGSSGIGLEVVNLCRNYDAKVFSFSRSENGVNITDIESVKHSLKGVYEREGRIDYVVNTAGILQKEPLANMSYEDIINGINVNYLGAVITAKESLVYLKETKGHLLFYTSSSYTRGRSMYSLYSSSKAAIVNLTQALAEEWSDFGIKVNCINPERTRTPLRIRNFGSEPEGTLLNPEDVAKVSVNTLLSDISGEVIDVKLGTKLDNG